MLGVLKVKIELLIRINKYIEIHDRSATKIKI